MSTVSRTSDLIAPIDASTGPTPIWEVSKTSPSIESFTVAVADTDSPVITLSPSNFMYSLAVVASSVRTIDFKSSSVTQIPLSPMVLT